MPNDTSHTQITQGWTSSPNGRGTIDIIWSSAFTIFLCSWSILCVNVPARDESFWRTSQRKVWLAGMCGLGPEFLLFLAIGQWESARQSFDAFHRLDHSQWSMKHAFFADMGGFILRTADGISFPLNAKQLHYMIVQGYIPDATVATEVLIDKLEIDDRNKTDFLVRLITIAQITWFVVSVIGRAIQHLTTTTLELTTLGFIATTMAVSFFWAHKPADVRTAYTLSINHDVAEILSRAGVEDTECWFRTPLDFLNDKESYFTVYWTYCVNILQRMRLVPVRKARPITSIPDDEIPSCFDKALLGNFVALIFSGVCSAINVTGWNFWFPSSIERTLWRVSSIVIPATLYIGMFSQCYLIYLHPTLKRQICRMSSESESRSRNHEWVKCAFIQKGMAKCKSIAVKLRNLTPAQDPAFDVEYKILVPALFFASQYAIARAYLLLEDVISLRALPPDAYHTVNWSQFFPHV